MKEGQDLQVEGTMSARLYYYLTEYYIPIARTVIPSLRPVAIKAEALSDAPVRRASGGVATGFSAGVDSFCVLADHSQEHLPPNARVTHLLFNNVGAHAGAQPSDVGRALFRTRASLVAPAAHEMHLPLIEIDSNLNELLEFNFPLTHVPRNIAAALVLQKLFRRFLYASTASYEKCYVGPSHDIAYADPVAVHLLSTESTECISSGCQHTRVQKTQRIASVPLSRRYLNVCVNGDFQHEARRPNCSECWKCARTLLTLEVAGLLEEYANVFDLKAWARVRGKYIRHARLSTDKLEREVISFAEERRFPLPSVAAARVSEFTERVIRRARRTLRSRSSQHAQAPARPAGRRSDRSSEQAAPAPGTSNVGAATPRSVETTDAAEVALSGTDSGR